MIFVVLISFLLFYVRFQEFNKEYSTFLNTPVANYVNYHENTNEVVVFFDFSSVEDREKEIFKVLKEINFPAAISQRDEPVENEYLIYKKYVYGSLNKVMYIMDTTSEVDENEDFFITNDKEDPRKTHLVRYLDSEYYNISSNYLLKIEIMPLEQVGNLDDTVPVTFMVEDEALELFFEKVNATLDDELREDQYWIIDHDTHTGQSTERGLNYYFELPKPILYTSTISLLILLYIQMKSNHKEITIRRLHGNRNAKIFRRLMFKQIYINLLLFLVIQILMFMYYVGNLSKLAQLFLTTLYPDIVLYISILIGFIFVFYLYFNLIMKASTIKSRAQNTITLILVVMLKIFVVVILVIPLIETGKTHFLNSARYKGAKQDKLWQEKVTIEVFLDNLNDRESSHMLYEFIENNNLGLRDGYEYLNVLTYYNSEYMSETQREEEMKGYNPHIPFVMMNQVSIQDYVFKDEHHQEIDLNVHENENWILAPISFKEEIEEKGIKCFGDCIIQYYSTDLTILDMAGESANENKLIYVMNQYTDEYDYYYGITDTMIEGKMQPKLQEAVRELEKTLPKHNLHIMYGDDLFHLTELRYQESQVEFVTQVILTFLLILLFTYTYLAIYFDSKGKELAIKYLNGVSYEKRYQMLFYILIISNGAIIVLLNYIKHLSLQLKTRRSGWLPLTSVYMIAMLLSVVEVAVIVMMINDFEKKEIASVMKGSED